MTQEIGVMELLILEVTMVINPPLRMIAVQFRL